MAAAFREICALEVDDGIVFDPTSVRAQETPQGSEVCVAEFVNHLQQL